MANIYDQASLVMIPSGTKTSKIFSQKPVNGDGDFTFSRSTAATRVNADGNIEKETQNLLTYSNDFTGWNIGGTLVGGQADKDGGTSAWSFTSASGTSGLYQNITTGGVQTFSAYFKKNTTHGVRIYMFGSLNAATFFDLNNGAVVTSLGGTLDASIEAYNSEWWRVSVTANSTLSQVYFYCTDNSSNQVVGTITIQDAQLEQGLVARDYIETTTAAVEGGITDNVPRLDYTDSSCPALLLEPQRTNVIVQSEYFGSSDWNKGNASVTDNNATSPEGIQNASLLTISAAVGNIYDNIGDSGDFTFSVFAKYVDMQYMRLRSTASYVYFDIQNGSVETELNGTGSIEDYGNGWYRCSVTGNNTNSLAQIFLSDTEGGTPTGTGSALIYGAQFEAGSYATSYIPTYGTSVTRNVEECSKDNVSDIVGVNDLSLYVEATPLSEGGAGQPPIFYAISENGAQTNICYLQMKPNNKIRFDYYTTGGQQFRITSGVNTIAYGTKFKAAVAIKDNDCVLYVNGTQIGTDTSGSTTNLFNFINCGTYATDDYNGSSIEQMLIFKTRLSNEELAALTTI